MSMPNTDPPYPTPSPAIAETVWPVAGEDWHTRSSLAARQCRITESASKSTMVRYTFTERLLGRSGSAS
jgi:hypothetical protein